MIELVTSFKACSLNASSKNGELHPTEFFGDPPPLLPRLMVQGLRAGDAQIVSAALSHRH